ncbi:glycosyltransferase family 2 protein [Paraburkholderia sp. DHOC27]|uniref:glycosyltransferase family 2 protein n=1 Tax=Paraburkholderia sp. DHOC27 TaxID=2303330 RepID=UPI000E3E4A05|nr:glycosyltransferase family 2 protein [Paraburkholderia sp. DHOC27]RFU45986.1 glycosyltransferase family 2 protein [Paraburkholderia sp. DHOC27]
MTEATSSIDRPQNADACNGRRIFAVVVTFNPDIATFKTLLGQTHDQVEQIVVVDNGSRKECTAQLSRLCAGYATLCLLPDNIGIAAAQNRGVERARAAGATDVLLLDHDSVPTSGMVSALAAASGELCASGESVAAVGPLIVERQTQIVAPVPQILEGQVQFHLPSGTAPVRCEYLIAAGTLIPIHAFQTVGPMNEAYFVDQVDVEWCLRAGAAGLGVYCVPRARLDHAIGDEVVGFWMFGWRQLAVHSPLRDYYYFRNSLRLMFSGHAAPPWRRFWTRRLLRLLVLQTMFVPPRWRRLRAMVSGAWAAIAERCLTRGIS